MTEKRKSRLKRQLQESRFRLLQLDEDLARPLTDMLFVATADVFRMSANEHCIFFDPDWLQKLGDRERDFVLAHQLMHITLGHIHRPTYYRGDRFHLACDIIANSHLETLGWQETRLPAVGRIYRETFFPTVSGRSLDTPEEALDCVPFDPATLPSAVRRTYMIDSEYGWDHPDDHGENGVIVLGPDDKDPADLMTTPTNGTDHAKPFKKKRQKDDPPVIYSDPGQSNASTTNSWDTAAADEILQLRTLRERDNETGDVDVFLERIWQRADNSVLDWRSLLDRFIQEDVCDYSFTPPDKRMQDSAFFLPDYNVMQETPKAVLFLVDTSGSIDDNTLSSVYGEICRALSQFNGGLVGMLSFFDTRVSPPVGFCDVADLLTVTPRGGGGTDFHAVFDYIRKELSSPPASIVIFTDGHADFPDETAADNIPVLWLFSDTEVAAPWGKQAYVSTE